MPVDVRSAAAPLESLAWITCTLSSPSMPIGFRHHFAQPGLGSRHRDPMPSRWQVSRQNPTGKSVMLAARIRGSPASSSKRPPICAPAPTVLSASSISFPNFNPWPRRRLLRENERSPARPFALVISRMRHQIFRADGDCALQFPAERFDRFRANLLVRRREIDQIVVVNHQRRQVVFLARPIQERDRGSARDDAFHCRGLDEKIWKVFAPSSAALSADRSGRPRSMYVTLSARYSIIEAGAVCYCVSLR